MEQIQIKAITWNEELFLPKWYKWYIERFPNAFFTIYDNQSTDQTVKIAKDLKIEVISFDTKNKFNDIVHRNLKNQKFDSWVIFSDLDELADINWTVIKEEERINNTNIFRFSAYDVYEDKYYLRSPKYDKNICWNGTKTIPNFDFGAHNSKPSNPKWSTKEYRLYHYKYPSLEYYLNRTKLYKERFDEQNKALGHGKEYFEDEEVLIEKYNKNKEKAIKIC